MPRFKVRWGNRGMRVSIFKARSIVDARRKFMRLHPRAKIDSTELVRRKR